MTTVAIQLWSSWGYKQAAFTAGGSSQPRGGHFHAITSFGYQLLFAGSLWVFGATYMYLPTASLGEGETAGRCSSGLTKCSCALVLCVSSSGGGW